MLLSHDSLQNDYSKTPQKLNITSVGHDMGGQYAIAEDKDTSLHTPPPPKYSHYPTQKYITLPTLAFFKTLKHLNVIQMSLLNFN